jgi:hypothetical protein
MTDFEEEMGKVLGIYRCDQLISLFEDFFEIVKLYNVDETDDWVKDVVAEDDVRNVRLIRTVYLLSKLAHNHSDMLKRVKRVAPGLWQRMEKESGSDYKNSN